MQRSNWLFQKPNSLGPMLAFFCLIPICVATSISFFNQHDEYNGVNGAILLAFAAGLSLSLVRNTTDLWLGLACLVGGFVFLIVIMLAIAFAVQAFTPIG